MTARLQPPWIRTVLNDCHTVLSLSPNWDSYGASRIDPQNVHYGLELLSSLLGNDAPAPSVVPVANGSIQFEWHRGGIDLELTILSPGCFSYSFDDGKTEASAEHESDLKELKTLVTRLH